ncbi:hypothetical protein DAETH_44730 (plasmid) [Deinococcus aetherius]|uniref:SHOCT domain-containing protein n=1 Tax=Deinococcus aetherius TaxID=200252 RepID=A0ABM8AKZ5_9DEIO|nr:hypothetical protein [Deinococcus aetherius]BDP44504.1 hypothetical protein DAETH_44730 [Deinococcus aetherius]
MSGISNRSGICEEVRGALNRPGLHPPHWMALILFPAWLGQVVGDPPGPLVPGTRIGLHLNGSKRHPESLDPDRAEEDDFGIPASWEEVVEEMRREGALTVEEREAREAERLRLRLN